MHQFKEKKLKAISEVKNGKFKGLVNQLLNSVGLADSSDHQESWLDIVVSLAWEAASFIEPDHTEVMSMNPAGCVKIKCIQSGSRCQSHVIRGLVFRKHAAHKKMPAKYENPRLLLLCGMLSQTSGLASIGSVEHEYTLTEAQKSLLDGLEACHPGVILVEKSAPRIVLEHIVERRMTIVFGMKLHRLERVARCTGSSILSSDGLLPQKLKQCDELYFETFIEEHAVAKGGKMPSKTLMFLKECRTRLGCTVLLKGSHNDELKRIKCVVQCAVFMAYHFILETSFLLDQQVMLSTISRIEMLGIISPKKPASSGCLVDSDISLKTNLGTAPSSGRDIHVGYFQEQESLPADKPTSEATLSQGTGILSFAVSSSNETTLMVASKGGRNIPISDGLHEKRNARENEAVTKISSSLPAPSQTVYESISAWSGLNEKDDSGPTADKTRDFPTSVMSKHCHLQSNNNLIHVSSEAVDARIAVVDNKDNFCRKDDTSHMLDEESILVLISSRNASLGTICQPSHFSHIMFYRSFDAPLGRFLRNHLLNQTHQCDACGELPEGHFYYFAHHSKQLTIRVRRISKYNLPKSSEGKLWMWSRCGKCKPSSTNEESTKRVLMSTAACGLSFGKFLELSFSNNSSSNGLSICGHSLHEDFLQFFGLGPMIAMFKVSPIVTPQKLEIDDPIGGDKETDNRMTLFKCLCCY